MTEKCPHKPGPYNPFVSVRNKYEMALEKAIINKGFSRVKYCGTYTRLSKG